MSYPKNVKRFLICDKCGAETDMLVRVKVQKRLGVFEESYCASCVVLPVYKSESGKDVFVRRGEPYGS